MHGVRSTALLPGLVLCPCALADSGDCQDRVNQTLLGLQPTQVPLTGRDHSQTSVCMSKTICTYHSPAGQGTEGEIAH